MSRTLQAETYTHVVRQEIAPRVSKLLPTHADNGMQENVTQFDLRSAMIVSFFFLGAHGLLLISRSIAWDGWPFFVALQRSDYSTIFINRFESGHIQGCFLYPFVGLFHNPIIAANVLTFISFYVCTIVFLWFLCVHNIGDKQTRLWAALLFALQSNYLVTPNLGLLDYPVPYALFAIAALCHSLARMLRTTSCINAILIMLSGILFFCSFTLNSFLVFFVVVLWSGFLLSQKTFTFWSRQEWMFLLLPMAYWLVRKRPTGSYSGYNTIQFGLRSWMVGFAKTLVFSTLGSIRKPASSIAAEPWLLAVAGGTFVFLLACSRKIEHQSNLVKTCEVKRMLVAGTVTYLFGALPYIVVGKPPALADMASRWGELLPVGQAICLAAGLLALRRIVGPRATALTALTIISLFGTVVIDNYRRWDLDWYKQDAIIQHLRTNDQVRTASIVLFADDLCQLNNLHRFYRFYEYNGWLYQSYGDFKRLGLAKEPSRGQESVGSGSLDGWSRTISPDLEKFPYLRTFYIMQEYKAPNKTVLVEIHPGTLDYQSLRLYVDLKLSEIFAPRRYYELLNRFVSLSVNNLDG